VVEEVKSMEHSKAEIRLHDLKVAECDYALTKQVWVNLISNAVKYSRKKDDALIEIGTTSVTKI